MGIDIRRAIYAATIANKKNGSPTEDLHRILFGKEFDINENYLSDTKKSLDSTIEEDIATVAYKGAEKPYESPNRDAKVAFLIQFPAQYYVHKNIYKHLTRDAEFVVDTRTIRKNVSSWQDFLHRFARFLDKEGVHYRFFSSSRHDAVDLAKFFAQYETIVSHSYLPKWVRDGSVGVKKLVRVMYGHAKDAYDFGPWLADYDLALNYGSYSQKLSSNFVPGMIVGNPKFDDWISNENVPVQIPGLNPRKNTVLYLPTHGNLSSLEWFLPVAADIASKYNLIIKPHHFTVNLEPARKKILESFSKAGAILIDDFSDTLPVIRIADAILLDNSGAIFEAVLARKPVVLFDFLDENFLDDLQWKDTRKRSTTNWIRPLTYENSIEQRIKKEPKICPGPVVRDTHSIQGAIERSIKDHSIYRGTQDTLCSQLFRKVDGKAGFRAAKAIKEITSVPRVRRRPSFLEAAFRTESIRKELYNSAGRDFVYSIADSYLNLTPLKETMYPYAPSIKKVQYSIVVPTYNRAEQLKQCIEALETQPAVKALEGEILIIDDASADNTQIAMRELIRSTTHSMIRYVRLKRNCGPGYARNVGILLARGEYICFTDDDVVVTDKWLSTIRMEFENNPEIAGVGGWKIPRTESMPLLVRFKYMEDLQRHSLMSAQKGTAFFATIAGDTASMCYHKSALIDVGGFNPRFSLPGAPAHEDWELKSRIHQKLYALLYTPRLLVHHRHAATLSEFIRRSYTTGWGFFLLARVHPHIHEKTYFFMTHPIPALANDWKWISALQISFWSKLAFLGISMLRIFVYKASKYIAIIEILDNKSGTKER